MNQGTTDMRRRAMLGLVGLATAAALGACSAKDDGDDVSATEDLMREHGVLRRILVLYREAATRIRSDTALDAGAIAEAATLFRTFGEDYHEHKLEEEHIFPAVRKAGGPAVALVAPLLEQHQRGREINLFLVEQCRTGRIATARGADVARALDGFARMYEEHAAFEDTILFQAWKKALSKHELAEASEQFEQIERDQFKGNGFDLALGQVARIEQRLGIGDLAMFTAPASA